MFDAVLSTDAIEQMTCEPRCWPIAIARRVAELHVPKVPIGSVRTVWSRCGLSLQLDKGELGLVVGVLPVIKRTRLLGYTRYSRLTRLMERRSVKIAAVALANKNARIVWAMMVRNESYRAPQTASI